MFEGKRILAAVLCLFMVMSSSNAWALWGDAKTSTKDGDAKMGLPEYKGLKHAVGVKDFENQAGWHGRWELGRNLSIMLESALFDTGRFVLVEREKVKTVLSEQDLAASGRTAKAKKVAKTGLIRSAKYIASGAVTEVEESQSGGLGGLRIERINLGIKREDAQVTIIAKLIDTTTSEIVSKKRIVGKAGKTGIDVGYSGPDVGVDLGGFKKTPLGQAAQDCINQAAKFFAETMEEFPFEGSVIKVGSKGVIINRGSQFGVEVGQVLTMTEEGEMLLDPDTGEILDYEEGEAIGKLKVKSVKEKVSYCDVIEGEKNPDKGTTVTAR
jgi:curli biogenesis system outer membrane secretion channel CsgG